MAVKKLPFQFALFACVQFVVLTALAMLIYPGGSLADKSTTRYSFFDNFFSELGMTVTAGGKENPWGAVLFFVALTLAGLGLIVYFVTAPGLFRTRRITWLLSLLGSAFGIVAGAAFVGVAWTPANLAIRAHGDFVMAAFEAFLGAVLFYAPAIFLDPSYPRRFGWVYVAFAALLAGYVWLLTSGPGFATPQGVKIQATGQKAIVYAAIVVTLVQSLGALQQVATGDREAVAG